MKSKILQNFYNGELCPMNTELTRSKEFQVKERLGSFLEDELRTGLAETETLKKFEKYVKNSWQVSQLREEEVFMVGFRIGALLMVDVFDEESIQKIDD